MQFSARQDVTLKNYDAQSSFYGRCLSMGSWRDLQFYFQNSAITSTPLESSPLGELKYAISAGYDVRPKNKSIRKCKKMTLRDGRTWSLFCGLVQTSSDKFGYVRTRVKCYFSSTVSRTLSKFGPAPNLHAVF